LQFHAVFEWVQLAPDQLKSAFYAISRRVFVAHSAHVSQKLQPADSKTPRDAFKRILLILAAAAPYSSRAPFFK
jgi:hypothetical protein